MTAEQFARALYAAFWTEPSGPWVEENPVGMDAVTLDGSFSLLGIAGRILQDYEVVKK